ncbi:GHKL domain-containing protein [Actinomyces sp. B33]|uniref:ATP-binding protein n=1 Tax=Actinomyces sp. B33 TaxID=2942131 RepID=UPI002340D704|nr:sensor histidine kinase [Actinomyces sp. B33]MDC4232922.1 GHKL domain-containing protein [Actinomyces sp. B33]
MFEPLPDIPRLYTALAEAGACLTYMSLLRRQVPAWRLASGALVGFPVLIVCQLVAGALPVSLWLAGMVSAVALMGATIRLGTGISLVEAAHLTFRAFILAELAASLVWQLLVYFSPAPPRISAGPLLGVCVLYAVFFCLARALERRNIPADEPLVLDHSDLWLGATITVITFAMSNLSFVSTSTPFSGRLGPEIFYIRTLVDLCGYAALYAQQERIVQIRTAAELASIEARLESQHSQYLQSKTDIEAIGRAHHDLKHQIALLRSQIDPQAREAGFDEIDRQMAALGQRYHSGNPVLDVLLTSKGRICAAEGIDFTVIADGSLLSGMTSMDIATLFGNALDNAIEASRRVADTSHRIIKVMLTGRGQMAVIRIENWFVGDLDASPDGTLRTMKSDRDHHGYGVKSIRWTARKYGGEATTSAEGNWFALTVLLPRAPQEAVPDAIS